MARAQGVVRVHQDGPTLRVQVEGWGTMAQSLPLRRYVENALTMGVTGVQVDLSPCQYLDSTFLGTLFLLRRSLQRRCRGDMALNGLSQPCRELLRQMGVDNLFPLVPSPVIPREEWLELEGACPETHVLAGNVLQAHQELAAMEGKIGDTFRPVAQCLAREMDTHPEM